ncbi:FAD-binding oxidoreductase [Planococcus sp. APC 4015]|nr:FAD-binding oxidoreductase [Planococcus sp. APC 4015]
MSTVQHTPLDHLASLLDGDLTLPGQLRWDDARRAWQLAVDQHPVAVVEAESVADIVATVHAAARAGLRVAPQSTGHNAQPLGPLEDTILLRTNRMRGVTIDAEGMSARVEAGAIWADVVAPAAEHGLAALAGSSPTVGVVGYTLGGGIGWLARSHGLASNSVTAIEVVDAAGGIRRVDAEHDADLFWALRGGGGAAAIVSAMEFRLYPLTEVFAGALMWPIDRAADVVDAWRQWVRDVPASVTSLSRVLRYPTIPDLPPFLQGRSFVSIEFAIQEEASVAEEMLHALRALQPEIDTAAVTPVSRLGMLHGDPPTPVPAFGEVILLAELNADCVEAFVEGATDDAAGPLLSIEMRHLGGELAPGRGEGGALDALDAEALVFAVGTTPTPEARAAVTAAAGRMIGAVERWGSPREFANFVEQPRDAEKLYGQSLDRLRRIKAAYDPTDLIRSNHPVG